MLDPISTYRIQFNKNFGFKDFKPVIPYLYKLGIKTVYASPIYTAVSGSNHGYDVTNPNEINPEIGTIEELREISAQLKQYDMHWIQDIVPNHMGFHQQNAWLMDVLKNGESSVYRHYFDIISPDLDTDPLMVPFLGADLEEVISNNELELIVLDGKRFLRYFDHNWPLRDDNDEGGQVGIAELLSRQHYRLCSYQETSRRINYRRFFTVNSLICMNMQRREVFDDFHRLSIQLLEEGVFQGLRIDHVDGLADPAGYLDQLRECCGPETYIVVEKILEPGEALPATWPVQGTTGYDYLGLLNQLFTNQKAVRKFDNFYKNISNHKRPVHEQVLAKKRAFLEKHMQGELENLYRMMAYLKLIRKQEKQVEEETTDRGIPVFKQLILELLVRLPVYRFYSTSYPLLDEEYEILKSIFSELGKDSSYKSALPIFKSLLLGKRSTISKDDPAIIFFRRLMQFSGPLMAKGVEDTLMYTYNRFIGNNEVGDSPEVFGITSAEFHDQLSIRARHWPFTMNATATHDTKRGEDARARLAVLTDLRSEWLAEVKEWQVLNKELKHAEVPDANDEYFIYQTLVATCPEKGPADDDFEQRFLDYIEKALRESKRNSDWDEPDLDYESHTKSFIQHLLDPSGDFWPRFNAFLQKVAAFGKLGSLSSLVMKHTLPGVPDTYQGTEFWDLSMVDPDNRRPVDYQLRAEMLQHNPGGHLKIQLLRDLLQLRLAHSEVFAMGNYIPLAVKGKYAANVVAYARQYREEWIVVASLINIAALIPSPEDLDELDWKDTHIVLPKKLNAAYGSYRDVLNNISLSPESAGVAGDRTLEVAELFKKMPFAIRSISLTKKVRGAGILMPVSSLPSAYGIGDFGPAARQFLSFLNDCGMKYWQVLPMNPLSAEQSYSPYSSTSVMAGNILLISPEELSAAGLLSRHDLLDHRRRIKRNVSYPNVTELKNELLAKAFHCWKAKSTRVAVAEFQQFCRRESDWLEDYAMFVTISTLEQNRPWYDWPEKLRDRNMDQLDDFRKEYALQLEECCWQQFIFFQQWNAIKTQANALGINIIGDLPFYTAHNSADVWVHKKQFALDKDGRVSAIAGVPPDYFNAEGQLWGMPVYNWKAMNRTGFDWWIKRIAKNLEIYDQIRLDHFRAFSEYWEVPAGSETAKTGEWKPGPGAGFFKALQTALAPLPLIAEDLGEISPDVYQLRDEFGLPGMKVLQFAFGDDLGSSIHAPHNFVSTNCVVYTGTHDNNTTKGWYEEEASPETRKQITKYTGAKVTAGNASIQMIRLAFNSIAAIAIVPMQDLLNKSGKSRMNTPASVEHNWTWRLKPEELKPALSLMINNYLILYGR